MKAETLIWIVITIAVVALAAIFIKSGQAEANVVKVDCVNGIESSSFDRLPNGAERVVVVCNPKGKQP